MSINKNVNKLLTMTEGNTYVKKFRPNDSINIKKK